MLYTGLTGFINMQAPDRFRCNDRSDRFM